MNRPPVRPVVTSVAVGLLHACVLLFVATELGYDVGPDAYTPIGTTWRYVGLVVVAAAPVWLTLRYALVTPVVALVVTTGYVLGMELLSPGPTFRDVAELERLAEPTGIVVVEGGLYIVRYMVNASVWTVGFLLVGLVEYATRTAVQWLPQVPTPVTWVPIPASRREAIRLATAGGLFHAVVMVWFAVRLGVTATEGLEPLLYLFGGFGMWVPAAVPLYLLARHRRSC